MKKMIGLLILLCFSSAVLSVPATVNYQGRLLDNAGIPVTATDVTVVVKVWNHETSTTSGNNVYTETHTVNIADGVYSLQIGTGSTSDTFDHNLFDTGVSLWFEITVSGETLSPRHQFLAGPYSFQSENAQTLQNQPASAFATSSQVSGLLTELKRQCLQAGNAWSDSSSQCVSSVDPGDNIVVLPFAGGFIPLSRLFLSGPDNCAEDHYHGTANNCDNEQMTSVDPDCGFGTVSQLVTILKSQCAFP